MQSSVRGLNASDEERDAITVDIEPVCDYQYLLSPARVESFGTSLQTLGVAFRARRRAQINVEFWAGKDILIP